MIHFHCRSVRLFVNFLMDLTKLSEVFIVDEFKEKDNQPEKHTCYGKNYLGKPVTDIWLKKFLFN